MAVEGTVWGVQARKVVDGEVSPVVNYRDDAYCKTEEGARGRVARLNEINDQDGIFWEVYPIYPAFG